MFLIFMERNTEGLKDRDVWNYFPAVQGGEKVVCGVCSRL